MSFEDLAATALEVNGPRQAALLVHAMAASDREWLWEKLSVQEQDNLRVLLTELESLGIPADRSFLAEVLASVPNDIAAAVAGGGMLESLYPSSSMESGLTEISDEAFLAQLDEIDATILASVLRSEPPLLIARLLLLRDWPWQHSLLEKLSHGSRQKVQSLLQSHENSTGASLSDALLRLVRSRFEKAAHTAVHGALHTSGYKPAAPKPSKLAGIQKWWQQLRGAFA